MSAYDLLSEDLFDVFGSLLEDEVLQHLFLPHELAHVVGESRDALDDVFLPQQRVPRL